MLPGACHKLAADQIRLFCAVYGTWHSNWLYQSNLACLDLASQGARPSSSPCLANLPLYRLLELTKSSRSLSRHFGSLAVCINTLSPPRSQPKVAACASSQPCHGPVGLLAEQPAGRSFFSGLFANLRGQVQPHSDLARRQPVQRSAYGVQWTDEYR